MNNRTRILALGLIAIFCVGLTMFVVGCKKEETTPAAPAAKFVNSSCPLLGSKIDPANVPDTLTRDFKGQKVAFCCADCLPKWDELSDTDKAAKLAKVKIAEGG